MKKYISEFVEKQQALNALNKPKLLFNSTEFGAYKRSKHGDLTKKLYIHAVKK